MPIEREAKLEVGVDFNLPSFGDAVDHGTKVLDATYYDTADLRLAREGITLRHRNGTWTLKLPESSTSALMARDEIEVDAPPDSIPSELLSRLGDVPIAPVARLRSNRRRLTFGDDLELDDDTVEVLDGNEVVATFREIEVEVLNDGGEAYIQDVVDQLCAAGASDADPTPKVIRALKLLGRYTTHPHHPPIHGGGSAAL